MTDCQQYSIPISNSLAIRVYQDTRPHKWKIAKLQKGLVLAVDGTEVIGAGSGFGFPMLQYSNETYFSGSSNLHVIKRDRSTVIREEFLINMIKRNEFASSRLESRKARRTLDSIGLLYRSRLRFLRVKELLVRLGVHTRFVKSECMGKVTLTYTINEKRIQIESDFSQLERRNLEGIFLLNEQGNGFFSVYTDSQGARLIGDEIGHWQKVDAAWARITDLRGRIGFRLESVPNSILRRGQEFIDGFLDWIGLDYEIDPKTREFAYSIDIIGRNATRKEFSKT